MGSKTGVNISPVGFSKPQGGKGTYVIVRLPPIRQSSHSQYFNKGNNVTTAREFRDAIMSSGGVPGIRVAVVDAANICDPRK